MILDLRERRVLAVVMSMKSTRGDKKPSSQLFEDRACPDRAEAGAPGKVA